MTAISMELSLAYSAILTLAMLLTAGFGKGRLWTTEGFIFGMSNRENYPEAAPWAGRADRAAKNMMEGLLMFGALVVAAQGLGVSNEATTLGATLFFWGRVLYFPIYVAGIAWVRTGVWAISLAGMVIIALELL